MIEITIQIGSDETHGAVMMQAKMKGEATQMQRDTAEDIIKIVKMYLDYRTSSSKSAASIDTNKDSQLAKAIEKRFKFGV